MPFTEFRFLNGSNTPADSTVVVGANPPQINAGVAPKSERVQPVPPPPAPPPPANAINMADVVLHGGQAFNLPGPVISPDGTDFESISTVILEGKAPNPLCAVIARTMGGQHIYEELT